MLSTSFRVCFMLPSSHSANALTLGHPYEPLLAVSGIDNTIKIFSPDARAQADARGEITSDSSDNHSMGSNISAGQRRSQGLASRKCMDRCYQIITNNDQEREGGIRDASITVRARTRTLIFFLNFTDGNLKTCENFLGLDRIFANALPPGLF